LTKLLLNVWDISVTEQPSLEEWHIAICLDQALILKVMIMTMGSSVPLDSFYRKESILKQVNKFKVVYEIMVVYRSDKAKPA
jgi:hypothetical protein